ncbi:MAG: hypothetical protein ABI045_04640 [Flavobacteriales bacterium]
MGNKEINLIKIGIETTFKGRKAKEDNTSVSQSFNNKPFDFGIVVGLGDNIDDKRM